MRYRAGRVKVSVAMATHDGTRFLTAQMTSIFTQTRPPDEIVVVDDASTDGTLDLLRTLQPPEGVTMVVEQEPARAGVVRAFERATRLATGDVIFFADQDDVWYPHKIERILDVFATGGDATLLVAHDADFCDEHLTPTGESILQRLRTLARGTPDVVHAMATAVTRELVDLALPFPSTFAAHHDGWVHWIARSVNARTIVDDRLAAHRRHARAATGHAFGNALRYDPRMRVVHQARRTFATLRTRDDALSREIAAHGAKAAVLARIAASPRWTLVAGAPAFLDQRRQIAAHAASLAVRSDLLARPRGSRALSMLRRHVWTAYDGWSGWGVAVGDLLAPRMTAAAPSDGALDDVKR